MQVFLPPAAAEQIPPFFTQFLQKVPPVPPYPLHWPFVHAVPSPQGLQEIDPPHPSEKMPHSAPTLSQVIGVQVTHWLFVQMSPLGHVPGQVMPPPQPSSTTPQLFAPHTWLVLFGVQSR